MISELLAAAQQEPVLVALITAVVGPTVLLVIGWGLRQSVGRPNGRGNLMQMMAKVLDHLERHDDQIDQVDQRTATLVDGQATLINSQAGQDNRLARLERDRPPWWITWAPLAALAAMLALARRRRT